MVGGRSVGVPGVPRLLETVHRALRQAGHGPRCSSRRSSSPKAASRFRRGLHTSIADDVGRLDAAAGDARLFLRRGRRAAARPARMLAQSGLCRDACGRSPTAAPTPSTRARSPADIVAAVQRPSDQSRPAQPRRPRRLRGQGAAGGLRALSRLSGLRHGTALLRRARRSARSSAWSSRSTSPRSARTIRKAGASSATPPASPSPTASATSPTAISCRCPRACSTRPISRRAPR